MPGVGAAVRHVTGVGARMGAWGMPRPVGPMKGADQRRNTSGSGGRATSRGCPNGAIPPGQARGPRPERIGAWAATGGTETSQYPEEERACAE